MKTLRGIAVCLVLASVSCASLQTDFELDRKRARSMIESGHCAEAWELLWPWAKNGDADAIATLATGIVTVGLTPPGSSRDAITQFRHALILTVHGMESEDQAIGELMSGLLRSDLVKDMGGKKLQTCLKKEASRDCINSSVQDAFVPSFAQYVEELDILSASTKLPVATCRISPNTQGNITGQ